MFKNVCGKISEKTPKNVKIKFKMSLNTLSWHRSLVSRTTCALPLGITTPILLGTPARDVRPTFIQMPNIENCNEIKNNNFMLKRNQKGTNGRVRSRGPDRLLPQTHKGGRHDEFSFRRLFITVLVCCVFRLPSISILISLPAYK